ncbi:MAG: aspartate/glutamate racemase family protein [Ruminococcus sp.]
MKKIGLIGGTGFQSTIIYYKELNRLVNEKIGGKSFPQITVESLDLCKALKYCQNEEYDLLADYVLNALNNLAKCGVDFGALTAGTMHIIFDKIKDKSPIPLVGIPHAVCDFAIKNNYKKLGLLGTEFTMGKDFFKNVFREKGIEIFVPCPDDFQIVNHKIVNELELGIVKDETREIFVSIINKMKQQYGIEAVILGCTELPLLLNRQNCPIPCLDALEIHTNELAEMIVK